MLAENPFPKRFDPEVDISQELSPDAASHFYYIIDNIRYMMELGRIDIIIKLLLLSLHLALPRVGH